MPEDLTGDEVVRTQAADRSGQDVAVGGHHDVADLHDPAELSSARHGRSSARGLAGAAVSSGVGMRASTSSVKWSSVVAELLEAGVDGSRRVNKSRRRYLRTCACHGPRVHDPGPRRRVASVTTRPTFARASSTDQGKRVTRPMHCQQVARPAQNEQVARPVQDERLTRRAKRASRTTCARVTSRATGIAGRGPIAGRHGGEPLASILWTWGDLRSGDDSGSSRGHESLAAVGLERRRVEPVM